MKYNFSTSPQKTYYPLCFSFPSSPLGQPVVADASCALSRAACIATRYGVVRRQFGSENGGPQDPGIAIEPNPF